jgi:hypothetical protein
MLKPVRLGLLALAGLCLVPFQSAAQSASPIADTFSNSAKATTNYGTNPIMMVQPGYSSYVQFNLSTLPTGAVVQKATLRLFLDSVTGKGQIDCVSRAKRLERGAAELQQRAPVGYVGNGRTSRLDKYINAQPVRSDRHYPAGSELGQPQYSEQWSCHCAGWLNRLILVRHQGDHVNQSRT